MQSGNRRRGNSRLIGPSIKLLIVLASSACLVVSCAGGAATPSPSPVITSTPPASPTALVVKPTLAAQPALTSMAVAARAMTITPSLAPRVRPTGTPAVGEMKIIVGDYYFNPQVVTVTVGTRVSWVPEGVLYHTIVSNDSPPVFRGGTAGLGTRAFERTFRRPGVYKYHCDYHPGAMNAVVVVIENN